MAQIDVEKFLSSKYNALLKETTESKMFNLGVCYGYFLTYKTLKELVDEQNEFKSVGNNERVEGLERQKEAIAKYLPKMLSVDEIKEVINSLEDKSVPSVMKHFKSEFAGKVDMGLVNKVLREYNN